MFKLGKLGKKRFDGWREATGLSDLQAVALLNISVAPMTPEEFGERLNLKDEEAEQIFADLVSAGLISD